MPMRKPRVGGKNPETQQQWVAYCMHELSGPDAADRPNEQKIAICLSAWRNAQNDQRSASERLADLLAKANYDHAQPRHLGSGRWAGRRGDIYPSVFGQHHTCPKCGFKWSTKR